MNRVTNNENSNYCQPPSSNSYNNSRIDPFSKLQLSFTADTNVSNNSEFIDTDNLVNALKSLLEKLKGWVNNYFCVMNNQTA